MIKECIIYLKIRNHIKFVEKYGFFLYKLNLNP